MLTVQLHIVDVNSLYQQQSIINLLYQQRGLLMNNVVYYLNLAHTLVRIPPIGTLIAVFNM